MNDFIKIYEKKYDIRHSHFLSKKCNNANNNKQKLYKNENMEHIEIIFLNVFDFIKKNVFPNIIVKNIQKRNYLIYNNISFEQYYTFT